MKEFIERVRLVLLRCIGDLVQCPICGYGVKFDGPAAKDAEKLYVELGQLGANNKFEEKQFAKIDREALNDVNGPIRPGPITLQKPPLGVPPQRIWKEQRIVCLTEAIQAYTQTGQPGKIVEWAAELLQLVSELEADRKMQSWRDKQCQDCTFWAKDLPEVFHRKPCRYVEKNIDDKPEVLTHATYSCPAWKKAEVTP
jgi:hypothetical protein